MIKEQVDGGTEVFPLDARFSDPTLAAKGGIWVQILNKREEPGLQKRGRESR
jgi:hypothetical protein